MPVRNAESWPREHFYSVTYLFFLPFKTYKTYFLLTHIIFILFFCVSSYGSLFNFGKLLLKLPKKKINKLLFIISNSWMLLWKHFWPIQKLKL